MRSDEPIMKAGGHMLARHLHRIPIVDNGKLVGIISREEVFSAILKKHLGF
jgi:CBS domain-containing protein